ncbi:MAG: hypothetical protein KDI09_17190 [Halioglobus sp.]|nr:hypothetical protein [Halioglobus sp.]
MKPAGASQAALEEATSEEEALACRLEKRFDSPVLPGNRVHTLINGDRIFPPMLQAIDNARSEICFETFIYWSGDVAREFASALSRAARRDVRVHVLLDWWGAQRMDDEFIEQMRNAGAKVRYFNPLRWWQLQRMNYRTHRKILVVDRCLAFTGGVGIAEEWRGDAQASDEWHDIHYRISGPAVQRFHEAFCALWCEVLKEPLLDAATGVPEMPGEAVNDDETVDAQVLSSSPRSGSEVIYRLFRHAIDTATDSLQLMTAYFVPDEETISAMTSAADRGVDIAVMVPGRHNDSQVVRYSSRAAWGRLLRAGVHMYVYEPTMLHAKVTVVDSEWVIVGSANFDNRSFALNDEIVMNVVSRPFAQDHQRVFEQDMRRCRSLDYEDWRARGIVTRCKEVLSDLARPQL